MRIKLLDKIDFNIKGKVLVRELDINNKIVREFSDNAICNGAISMLMDFLTSDENSSTVSGITHLGVGIGTPERINDVSLLTDDDRSNYLSSLTDLVNERVRVIRWEIPRYYKKDEFGNINLVEEPSNIVEFSFRLRQGEPSEILYISEIGAFGGDVKVNDVPYAMIEDVQSKGTLFSYRYYDPPIDKHPETILEFVWQYTFE